MQSKYDVFISYSHKDQTSANTIYETLVNANFKVWMDNGIGHGFEWEEEIDRALRKSTLLLVISQASITSQNVKDEISIASEQEVPILSIQIEDVTSGTFISPRVKRFQWIIAKEKLSPSKLSEIVVAVRRRIDGVNKDSTSITAPTSEIPKATKSVLTGVAVVQTNSVAISTVITSKGRKENKIFKAVRDGAMDVESTDKSGQTALHYAALYKEPDVLRLLLERGANVNARDRYGATPLHLAVEDVHLSRLLILKGADFEATAQNGTTPRVWAYEFKATQTMYLLDLLGDIKRGEKTPNQALRTSLKLPTHKTERILNAIVSGADDFKARDNAGRTALHWAAQESEPELVEMLLNKGADINARDNKGNTPAMLAHAKCSVDVEEVIRIWQANHPSLDNRKTATKEIITPSLTEIEASLPQEQANERLQTVLLSKGRYKSESVLRAIRGGATDFSLTDQFGRTALYWAVMKNDVEAVAIALSHGADVNAASTMGDTPLDVANDNEFLEIIQLLKNTDKASPAPPRNAPKPPAKLSTANQALQEILLKKGDKSSGVVNAVINGATDFSLTDEAGRTALHWAVIENEHEVIQLLLSEGADANAVSATGETPLALAENNRLKWVEKILKQHGAR